MSDGVPVDENYMSEMKQVIRQRIQQSIFNYENRRTNEINRYITDTTEMLGQLLALLPENDACTEAFRIMQRVLTMLPNVETPELDINVATIQLGRGRPTIDIPSNTLEFLVNNNFKRRDIAKMLGVSDATIKRRLRDLSLGLRDTYSTVSDEELEVIVGDIIAQHPNIGRKSVIGHLSSRGYRIQEKRVRKALHNVDPEGSLFRRLYLRVVNRRSYSVRAPQSLWHIDGYHKLIRWRIVVHGGIDGYSRLPVFLKASDNNRAATVLSSFREAVLNYGLPDCVRSDKGGENVAVARYMCTQHTGRKCFITGRSVHNQRIERFWVDLWTGCINLFYNLFFYMEETGLLDVGDERHMAALHYIFLPRIQQSLDAFANCMAHRPLRTERNMTPYQLWIRGRFQDHHNEEVSDTFGIDYNYDNINSIQDEEFAAVLVPANEVQALEVLQQIDPLADSMVYGIDLYNMAKECLTVTRD